MTVRVCFFPGAGVLPVLAAANNGMFSEAGLEVELIETRSSTDLMQGLIAGDYDIVHAAPDNFIAWADRTQSEVVAWIGGTSGPLTLVSAPDIADVAQLRGRSIAVDSPTSGFSSVLQTILHAAGLGPDDYHLDPIGATHLRYQALTRGDTVATLVSLPLSLQAEAEGFHLLADHTAVIPRFQGGAGGSLRGWLDGNTATADSYLASLQRSLTWLYAPNDPEDVIELVAELYEMERAQAAALCAAILDPVHGWPPSALIDTVGMEIVCELRASTIGPPALDPASYIDLDPYRRVMGNLASG